jgi:hypothetical protein
VINISAILITKETIQLQIVTVRGQPLCGCFVATIKVDAIG